MKRNIIPLAAAIAGAIAISLPAGAQDQSAADFYRGKRINLIVGYEAGSAYDVSARVIVRHIGKYLGQPTVIVQNMPGAGSIAAANHLFNVADRDGTVIGMIGRVLPYQAMLKQPGIRFDPSKFHWIGSPTTTRRACVATLNSRVQKAEDLFTHELLVGGTGAGSAATSTPTLLARLLGMKFRVVDGYKGANTILLAMERGEVEGICTGLETLETMWPDWLNAGKVRVLFNTEEEAVPEFKAPSVHVFAKSDEQRLILRLFGSNVELGQPILAPPGVPEARVAGLRRAFEATAKDPAYQADLLKSGHRPHFIHPDILTRLINEMMSAPPEIVERMQAASDSRKR